MVNESHCHMGTITACLFLYAGQCLSQHFNRFIHKRANEIGNMINSKWPMNCKIIMQPYSKGTTTAYLFL